MKINLKVRVLNPWFWLSMLGVILTAMGISPEMLTTWEAVATAFRDLVNNPYMLVCVFTAVLGVFNDPTTHGIKDSDLAMTYTTPKK